MNSTPSHHAVALFSGGLDSILAAKLIEEQGVRVTCLHFVTPFFGKPEKIPHWQKIYNVTIKAVDISDDYVAMMHTRPVHGFGSVINPCVDCKILMLRHARRIMEELGACCIVTGEVLGQRPMSQRRETLNIIQRDAGIKGKLLRPLCAQRLDPTEPELAGQIDRSKLLGISGRGRKDQMELAERFNLKEIPTPAGGCLLAEQENARSYWPILAHMPVPSAKNFALANTGRQYWLQDAATDDGAFWLTIGRKQADNDAIMALAAEQDVLFKVRDFPGPLSLGRFAGTEWPQEIISSAAAFVASYSPKAVRHAEETGEPVLCRVHAGSLDTPGYEVSVTPTRVPVLPWRERTWPEAREAIRAERKMREAETALHSLKTARLSAVRVGQEQPE